MRPVIQWRYDVTPLCQSDVCMRPTFKYECPQPCSYTWCLLVCERTCTRVLSTSPHRWRGGYTGSSCRSQTSTRVTDLARWPGKPHPEIGCPVAWSGHWCVNLSCSLQGETWQGVKVEKNRSAICFFTFWCFSRFSKYDFMFRNSYTESELSERKNPELHRVRGFPQQHLKMLHTNKVFHNIESEICIHGERCIMCSTVHWLLCCLYLSLLHWVTCQRRFTKGSKHIPEAVCSCRQ